MSKTIIFTRLAINILTIIALIASLTFLGLSAYNEGFTNGERDGSLFTAQYVAASCNRGKGMTLFGRKYHCMKVEEL